MDVPTNGSVAASHAPVSSRLLLKDGRTLGYATFGAETGVPLFYLHGAGSSRLEPAYAQAYAQALGLRVIGVDRPGYGLSKRREDASFAGFAQDVLELADALFLRHFAVCGMSAGAPHALHLAAIAPERVLAVALINGSAETTHPAWRKAPLKDRLTQLLAYVPGLVRRMATSLKDDPLRAMQRVATREQWTAQELDSLHAAIAEGMSQPAGVETLIDEADRVLRRSWGLDWSAIRCAVLAVCGERDPARELYRAIAAQQPNVSFLSVPGPHAPIVPAAAWERIAQVVRAAFASNAGTVHATPT